MSSAIFVINEKAKCDTSKKELEFWESLGFALLMAIPVR